MKMNRTDAWRTTSLNEPRGYIQPQILEELWFHTGTNCNLRCPFCFEGSKPGDNRIEFLTLADARRFIAEALELGVKKFSFTGGEPFVNPELVAILDAALEQRPCLILTNATEPLMNQMADVLKLADKPNPLRFRVSLDHPDPSLHDESRGKGNFKKALDTLGRLHQAGFGVSIARMMLPDEDSVAVDQSYVSFFRNAGVPDDITIVKFPEFHLPGSFPNVPEVTETCMTRYLGAEQRALFMCNFSKMVVRKNGQCGVYACTLVDDVTGYDLGPTLKSAMKERVMLGHHRCYSCFACGASCSEGV
ncbi:radical SAM protein [Pelovirga terrestris]|uniref:Radical SAM protein n=1 Tax=Pelovirga terrestris TaxID=2771352 RepID=A0A8J6R0C5_9BACT|nr:radical SAM protein [Pelovirga terrestris]MBD1401847.1 radical SAM protein [Pelovirga terrestris]